MLLTDYAAGIEAYLQPDREVVIAHSPEEMRDEARCYLAATRSAENRAGGLGARAEDGDLRAEDAAPDRRCGMRFLPTLRLLPGVRSPAAIDPLIRWAVPRRCRRRPATAPA